jgi:hypothetical protein
LLWRRPDRRDMRKWIDRALLSSLATRKSMVRILALRRALLYHTWVGDKHACLTLLDELARMTALAPTHPVHLIADRLIKANYYTWVGDDNEQVMKLVEEGLSLAEKTGIHIVDSFLATQGAEAAWRTGDDEEGVYMPVLYLDKALPIVIGREVWGYPKYQADLSLKEEAGVVRARVISEGTTLIDAELRLGNPIPPTNGSPNTFFLMKRIPSVTGPSLFDVKQLVTAVLRDEIQQEVLPGDATLRLGSTATDPLERIPVLEIVQGVYFTGGFVLDYGRVVHDYLAKG